MLFRPCQDDPQAGSLAEPPPPELSAGAQTSGQWGWGYHGAETAVQDDSGPQEGESNALDPRTRTDAKCNGWAKANRKSPLCERSQSLLPARRWARGHGGVRGPCQLPPPQRAPRRKALPSSVYIISSGSQPSGALILTTMTSAAAVCGSPGSQQAPC